MKGQAKHGKRKVTDIWRLCFALMLVAAVAWAPGPSGAGETKTVTNARSSSSEVLWESLGERTKGCHGYTVANAGDVNGDGYDDVIVTAFPTIVEEKNVFYSPKNVSTAYLFLGSSKGLVTEPVWEQRFKHYGDWGIAVASAGDINKDGYDDIVVGVPSPFVVNNSSLAGKVLVYLGGSEGPGREPAWEYDDEMGFSSVDILGVGKWLKLKLVLKDISRLSLTSGDVNGDGCPDVIVGAPYAEDGDGKILVFHGCTAESASGLGSKPDFTATSPNEYFDVEFGFSVSAGDVNGDGYDDVAVGAPGLSKLSVFYGSESGLRYTGNYSYYYGSIQIDNRGGHSVFAAADVNGDTYDDILFGMPWYSTRRGRVVVFYGSATGPADVLNQGYFYLNDPNWNDNDYFGASVRAGDVDGDGVAEIIIGAYGNGGGVFVYGHTGSTSSVVFDNLWSVTCDQENAKLGHSVSAGDVNGDAIDEVIVGAPRWDRFEDAEGKAVVYTPGLD